MELIINDLSGIYFEHQQKLIKKIDKISHDYEEKREQLICFEGISVIMEAFTTIQAFDRLSRKYLSDFLKIKATMEKKGKGFNIYIKEKKYIDTFQIFENYMSDCFLALSYYYPKNNKKIKLVIDELKLTNEYDDNDLYSKCEELVYNNRCNIYDWIHYIISSYNIYLDINNNLFKDLYVHSLNRNVLIHNNGIIDKHYLYNLEKKGINSNYKLNDLVYKNLDNELFNIELLLSELKECIICSYYKDTILLTKNYFSIMQ